MSIARSMIDRGSVRPSGRWAQLGSIASNVAMAGFFAWFAASHLNLALETGWWGTVGPLLAQELMLVFLYLTRRRSLALSAHPWDWAVGIAGTFVPFFFYPEIDPYAWPILGSALQLMGFSVAVGATVSLGRSIGIVAANRGVKTGGLYRLVRHPMYLGYALTYTGYLMAYPSLWNGTLILLTIVAMDQRARAEERLLSQSPGYTEFLERTRWRLIPLVY